MDNYLCPGCGQADVEIVAGDDIMLTSVVGQVEDQAEEPAPSAGPGRVTFKNRGVSDP